MNDVDVNEVEMSPAEQPEVDVDEKEVLRQSIEHNEAELRDAVEELTAAVKNEVTLGGRIMERPWEWLLGGFAVGLLLSRRRD